jgi:hypothetical protein
MASSIYVIYKLGKDHKYIGFNITSIILVQNLIDK